MTNVLRFPARVNDIPAMLRTLADRIENGEEGKVETIIAFPVLEDGRMGAYMWGHDVSVATMVGYCTMATHLVINNQTEDDD